MDQALLEDLGLELSDESEESTVQEASQNTVQEVTTTSQAPEARKPPVPGSNNRAPGSGSSDARTSSSSDSSLDRLDNNPPMDLWPRPLQIWCYYEHNDFLRFAIW